MFVHFQADIGLLGWIQTLIGISILVGGYILLAFGTDQASSRLTKWLLRGLAIWGAWFAMTPWSSGGPDSLSAQALGLLVACVTLRYGRQLRGIIDGEHWWEPNARNAALLQSYQTPRRKIARKWLKALNPFWLLIDNEEDGVWGDPRWSPPEWMVPSNIQLGWRRVTFSLFGRPSSCTVPSIACVWISFPQLRVPVGIRFSGFAPRLVYALLPRSYEWRWWRAVAWWFRNPLHNLTWYVLGVADKERVVRGPWAPSFHRPGGGWLWCFTDVPVLGLTIPLPFVSYVSATRKAYAGWRPSGSFGFKFNRLK